MEQVRKRYRVEVSSAYTTASENRARNFLASLTDSQRAELAELDFEWSVSEAGESNVLKSITEDWLEDHGGSREWWEYIRTYEEK